MGKKIAKELGINNEFQCFNSNQYYGKFNGYDMRIKYDYASLLFQIHFTVKGKDSIDTLNSKLQKMDKYAVARYKNPVLTITQACDSIKDMSKLANKTMKLVTEYLNENKYSNLCNKCNKAKDTFLVDVDDDINFYCDDCYKETTEAYIKELEEKKNIKENILLGIVGAIIGSIPGVILWLILTYLMINPTVVALIIMLGSAYGYKWMAKSMKLPGLILSIIIGFGFVILSNELSNAYTLYTEYYNQFNISLLDTYKAIPYYLTQGGSFRKIYQQDFFLSVMFGVFGGLSSFGIHRRYIANNKIKKLEVTHE